MPISSLLLAAIPAAWLLPNHYHPWISAWLEGLALGLLLLAGVLGRPGGRLPLPWAVALLLALFSVALQWGTGLILFSGDALLTSLYLLAFGVSIAMGSCLAAQGRDGRTPALEWLAMGTVVAAVYSVGIALSQWTQTYVIHLSVSVDLKPGARPYGNFAQANHLCTAAFLGLCSLALLRETRRIGRSGFWLGAAFLLLGMVMSGSRTGWLQASLVLIMVLALQDRARLCIRWPQALVLALIYAGLTWVWPGINEALLLGGGRSVVEQIEGGVRLPLWRSLLDAAGREALTGYGWQQVSLAQQAVALDHPPVRHLFEYSHNLILDLILWAGVPVGGLIAVLMSVALVWQLRALKDARAVWLMAGVLGVLTHSMLEFPIVYAYFLLPVGLALGAAHSLCPGQFAVDIRPTVLRGISIALGVVTGVIAIDYLQAEQNHLLVRLESARIGTQGIESEAPELRVLDQLQAFLWFARTEARSDMQPVQRARLEQVAVRFAYPALLLRQAQIAGLHGDIPAAERNLALLCSLHSSALCQEARTNWLVLQARYPELKAVRLP